MAGLVKTLSGSRTTMNNIVKLLTNFTLSDTRIDPSPRCPRIGTSCQKAPFHSTNKPFGLMEFFDTQKNWGQNEVKTGRSWKKDELRLKSNVDLHKLWFVLLKERNMLLTMEENCKKHWELFPSPERIDKIAESMKNLETVVRERNKAYHQLETGEHGERPSRMAYNQLGLKYRHRMRQYSIPAFMNVSWRKKAQFTFGGCAVRKFLRLYNEKKERQKRMAHSRRYNHVRTLFRKFPNMDIDALRANFPDVDIDKVRNDPKARGHAVPE